MARLAERAHKGNVALAVERPVRTAAVVRQLWIRHRVERCAQEVPAVEPNDYRDIAIAIRPVCRVPMCRVDVGDDELREGGLSRGRNSCEANEEARCGVCAVAK